jgi:hypothetical protein
MAAQCEKRGEFLQIMQNMNSEDSNELFNILTERISSYTENKNDTKNEDSYEEDEYAALYLKIEKLESENLKLLKKIDDNNLKINELHKTNYEYELNNKELEAKYHELINTFESKNNHMSHKENIEESLQLSIQLSELKGKLDAKEKNLIKIKEEKEKIYEESKTKIHNLQNENEILREKGIKYEILKEKIDKIPMEDVNLLKSKLVNCERRILELEGVNKKLKNYDVDKKNILKKIEELNFELIQEKEKNSDLLKENNYYKDSICQTEQDLIFYKKQLDSIRNDENKNSNEIINSEQGRKVSLFDIENEHDSKKQFLDLDTKLKMSLLDKESLLKDKKELEILVQKLSDDLNAKNTEDEKLKKKGEKYLRYKEERKTYLSKISDLTKKNHEYVIEVESIKLSKIKEKQEIETQLNVINII